MEGAAGRQVGFLAQDVEQVLPEAVKTMNDGYKAVDYSRLTALLVEAVKELKAENEEPRGGFGGGTIGNATKVETAGGVRRTTNNEEGWL
jgi:hypothetical protein